MCDFQSFAIKLLRSSECFVTHCYEVDKVFWLVARRLLTGPSQKSPSLNPDDNLKCLRTICGIVCFYFRLGEKLTLQMFRVCRIYLFICSKYSKNCKVKYI